MTTPRTVRRTIGSDPYTLVRVSDTAWRVVRGTRATGHAYYVTTTPAGTPLKCNCPHRVHKGAWCKHCRCIEELLYEDHPELLERLLEDVKRAGLPYEGRLRQAAAEALYVLDGHAQAPLTDEAVARADAFLARHAAETRLPAAAIRDEAARLLAEQDAAPSPPPPAAGFTYAPDPGSEADLWHQLFETEDRPASQPQLPYPNDADDQTEYGYYKQSANHR